MTILMWWGYSWHATFPNPPIHITSSIDSILKLHDDNLHAHFRRLGVSVGLLGWEMLTSMFTEILGRNDWLQLMDYIFTYFGKSSLMVLAPVALLKVMRTSLLAAGILVLA